MHGYSWYSLALPQRHTISSNGIFSNHVFHNAGDPLVLGFCTTEIVGCEALELRIPHDRFTRSKSPCMGALGGCRSHGFHRPIPCLPHYAARIRHVRITMAIEVLPPSCELRLVCFGVGR